MYKLNEEQRKLITDNYQFVYKKLRKYFRCKKFKNIIIESKTDFARQAVGYMAEATLSWDKKRMPYKQFCYQRCIQRFLDECRKNSEHSINNQKLFKKNRDEESIEYAQYGFVQERSYKSFNYNNLYNNVEYFNTLNDRYKNFSDVQKKDFQDFIIKKADERYNNRYSNKKARLYYNIINEYIVPKIFNKNHPTMQEIAVKIGIPYTRLCKTLKSKSIKGFFESILISHE